MSVIDLGALNGANGFRLDGASSLDFSGYSVSSAGDLNGDGFDDVIVGAFRADPSGRDGAGSSYVVFGRSGGFSAALDLAALNGTNGFRLDGAERDDYSGRSVSSAGDVNGDGFDDLIVGALGVAVPYDAGGAGLYDRSGRGSGYVLFGRAGGFAAALDLATLNGTNGFRLFGAADGGFFDFTVSSAGDVNGDGFDDLIVGQSNDSRLGRSAAGGSYVVFGRAGGFAATFDLGTLDGTNGFRLDGAKALDYSGNSVSSAGDVNGDGFDDLIVGAFRADPRGREGAGSSYVVFGRAGGFAPTLDLATLNPTAGFRLDGEQEGSSSGFSVSSAGDVNGDGFDDLIVGAPGAHPPGRSQAGSSYVVFGRSGGFAAALDLSGTDGLRIDGAEAGDRSGWSVSSAGDVNGDGFDDLIVGAIGSDPEGRSGAGSSYVLFGRAAGFSPELDLATLRGSEGFRLDGAAAGDGSGRSVSSAGDVNGDGFDDLIVGAGGADPSGRDAAGSSYVVFGFSTEPVTRIGGNGPDSLTGGTGGDLLIGGLGADTLVGGLGDDTLRGEGGVDSLDGGPDFDTASYAGAPGNVYVNLRATGRQVAGAARNDLLRSIEAVEGGDFGDTLIGDAGVNRLDGGAGDDLLLGGGGRDTLVGGAGADVFIYYGTTESRRAAPDLIDGFDGAGAAAGDRIQIRDFDANLDIAGEQPFVFGLVGRGGLQLVDDGADTLVQADAYGDARPDLVIRIRDGATVAADYTADDFIL